MKTHQDTKWLRLALAFWLLTALAVVGLVVTHPLYRSTTPIYRDAVANWLAHKAVYSGSQGFNYLPAFLPTYSLFARLPLMAGEILWRWAALAGLGYGFWKWSEQLSALRTGRAFAMATVLALPIGLSALRNGQSSAQLAACLVLAAWFLFEKRWNLATLWLCLSLVCKPLGIPAIGLAGMAFPRVGWRVALGVVLVLVLPYLFAPTDYVTSLYTAFATNLVDCFNPSGRTFADLNGVLMVFNLKLEGYPSLAVRVASGGALAVACWVIRKDIPDDRRALIWLALSGSYIMLFTPMNEGNSYVMLAPALGLWAVASDVREKHATVKRIAIISALMVLLPDIVGLVLGKDTGSEFAKFLYPLLTLVFVGTVLREMWIDRKLAIALRRQSSVLASEGRSLSS